MKKYVFFIMALLLLVESAFPVYAKTGNMSTATSFTIVFDQSNHESDTDSSKNSVGREILYSEKAIIKNCFSVNEMDADFYQAWLDNQNTAGLSSVTFTIVPEDDVISQKGGTISGVRLVYADCCYTHSGQKKQLTIGDYMKNAVKASVQLIISTFSKTISALATVLGIDDPDTYFGNNRVRKDKEYYTLEGASRVVTKFVELLAPVPGSGTKYYAWGGADGNYVRFGVHLYYKGAPLKSKDLYHQYYTQHYYDTTTLIKLVKNAYLNGGTYFEVYDTYAASSGGYTLKNRPIAKSKYLEYDNLCN